MTNKTIPALPAAGALAGTEPIETVQAGSSVRTTAAAIAALGGGGGGRIPSFTPLVSNPTPVTPDPTVPLYAVTTSGSGGQEFIFLNKVALDAHGVNQQFVGQRIGFYFTVKTNPADYVSISTTNNTVFPSSTEFYPPHQVWNLGGDELPLYNVGNSIWFIWTGTEWQLDYAVEGDNANTGVNFVAASTFLQPDAISTGSAKGADIILRGGDNFDLGNGGDFQIDAGRGVANGHVLIGTNVALPTSDPGVAGAIWDKNKTLVLSGFTNNQAFIDVSVSDQVISNPNGTAGTVTINNDNLVFSPFPASTPFLSFDYVNAGNTTRYQLVGISDASAIPVDGQLLPVMSQVSIADIITNDIGFYSNGIGGPGFDFHISSAVAPHNPYLGKMGSMEWDDQQFILGKQNLTWMPNDGTGICVFQMGRGFLPTSTIVSGNDKTARLELGTIALTTIPAVDPAITGRVWSNRGAVTMSGGLAKSTTTQNFTATFGVIASLLGTEVTQNIPGLLVTDQVHVECVSAPPAGMIIANCRVSAADTLAIYFVTAVALGITLGALNFRVTIIR